MAFQVGMVYHREQCLPFIVPVPFYQLHGFGQEFHCGTQFVFPAVVSEPQRPRLIRVQVLTGDGDGVYVRCTRITGE